MNVFVSMSFPCCAKLVLRWIVPLMRACFITSRSYFQSFNTNVDDRVLSSIIFFTMYTQKYELVSSID